MRARIRRRALVSAVVIALATPFSTMQGQERGGEPVGRPVADSIEARIDDPDATLPTARQLTHGPKSHWFGYYDKAQFDQSGRYVLGMAVEFEHRTPTAEDEIEIGMVDLEDGDRWIPLGTSRAWGWQQGCMLQWRPGHPTEVLWNDRLREGEVDPPPAGPTRFVTRVLDVHTRELRTLPRATYHVDPTGRNALSLDFGRVQALRPGYGYAGTAESPISERAPVDTGLWRMDLESGESTLVLSIADVAERPVRDPQPEDVHYFNHVQWSPDGRRFFFLHRWRSPAFGGFRTRGLTADAFADEQLVADDESDRWRLHHTRILSEEPGLSHFEWRDAHSLLIWRGGAYRLYRDDESGTGEAVWHAPNGHHSRLPGADWWVTDTYPRGRDRLQALYLYRVSTDDAVPLARLHSPSPYRGEWRCDLHPRIEAGGGRIVVDSPHGGDGRQLWLVEVPVEVRQTLPLPRVLILGDSISIGYTRFVKELLAGEARVERARNDKGKNENCEGTTKGLKHLDRWLAQSPTGFDVVHFNFGLHDLKRVDPVTGENAFDADKPRQAELEVYRRQLREIVRRLRASGAELIFGTTTPVPPGGVRPYRDVEDPARYNAVALEVMEEFGVAVDDLYSAMLPRVDEFQNEVDVHFREPGSRFLAAEVARSIRAALADRRE